MADPRYPVVQTVGSQSTVTLTAASQTTDAPAALDNLSAKANHTFVAVGSAGISAGAIQPQGSLDGVHWANIGSPVTVAANAVVSTIASGTPYRFLRAQVSTTFTGGTVTVTIASA